MGLDIEVPEGRTGKSGNTVWSYLARGRGVALINSSLAEQLPRGVTLIELARSVGCALWPACAGCADLGREHLAAAGFYQVGYGHALPFGGHNEQCRPVRTAQSAGKCAAIQCNALQDRAAFSDADAPLVGHIGVPDGVLRVDADAVRDALTEVGPSASVGQSTVLVDTEGHQAVSIRVSGDQRGVVGGHRHAVGERDVVGCLAHRS